MPINPDHAVIRQVLQGDTERYRLLIEKYERSVALYIYRMIADPSDREEICQDVFLRAFTHLESFRFESLFSTWLYRIAYHRAIEYLRKRSLVTEELQETQLGQDDLESEYESRQLAALVQEEIGKLGAEERSLVTLCHLQGCTIREVSRIVNRPEGTIKSDLYRIRKRMKQSIERRLSASGGQTVSKLNGFSR